MALRPGGFHPDPGKHRLWGEPDVTHFPYNFHFHTCVFAQKRKKKERRKEGREEGRKKERKKRKGREKERRRKGGRKEREREGGRKEGRNFYTVN